MASLFDLLSGMQSAGGVPEGAPIEVMGRKTPVRPDTVSPSFNPFEERVESPTPEQVEKQVVPRKGMFGTKGTLRDILGVLGDSLIAGADGNPIYAPQRQREKQADAMYGFTDNPLKAVERLAQTGNIEGAVELYKQVQANQNKEDLASIQRELAEAKGGVEGRKSYGEGVRLFGQYAGALARNPKLADKLIPVLTSIKETFGLGDEFGIPGAEDQGLAEAYLYGGTPANAQITDTRTRKLEALKESGRMARDNPPAAPRTQQPTVSTVRGAIAAKMAAGQALTPSEKQVWDATAPAQGRGRRPIPAPPVPGTVRKLP